MVFSLVQRGAGMGAETVEVSGDIAQQMPVASSASG